jgi:hypothetical protein
MDLKKLLAEREAVLKEKENEQLIEIKIEGYSENFILKVPEREALIELFRALGIKKFEKEIIDKIFKENMEKALKAIGNFVFELFIEPNFVKESTELMAQFNVQSRNEILNKFFQAKEILEIFAITVQRLHKLYEMSENTAVTEIKKKSKKIKTKS